MRRSRLWLPLFGSAVLLTACASILLTGVYNRSRAPESTLKLSERELALPISHEPGGQDRTPLTLHMIWRVESSDPVTSTITEASATRAAWITRSKLALLDMPVPDRVGPDTFASTLLVLEFDGYAHAREVSRACNPPGPARDRHNCELEVKRASRLYVVDAGRTVAELRTLYTDRTHFAIVSGVVRITRATNTGEFTGFVNNLAVDTIQGTEPLRSQIDPTTGGMLWQRVLAQHGFDAVIAFGRRLEPWNVSIESRQDRVLSSMRMQNE